MIDSDNITVSFIPVSDTVMYVVEFGSVKLRGYLLLDEAEDLRTELTKAINKARKET